MSEILTRSEPCCDCRPAIEWILCFDGKRRCRSCVHALAAANGWDVPPVLATAEELSRQKPARKAEMPPEPKPKGKRQANEDDDPSPQMDLFE